MHVPRTGANPRLAHRRRATRAGGEAGQALIEAAVTLPILLLVVLGIARFSVAYNNYIALTDAVRVGARQLAMGRTAISVQGNPCLASAARIAASAPTLNPANIAVTMIVNGTAYGPGAPPSAPSCPNANQTMQWGGNLTLSATYPCNLTIYGIDFSGGTCTLSAQTQVRIE